MNLLTIGSLTIIHGLSLHLFLFISSQTGAGVILCIEKALAQSGVSREDVNYINAHATSTPAGDLKEYQAMMHCFGQNPEVNLVCKLLLL